MSNVITKLIKKIKNIEEGAFDNLRDTEEL